MQCQDIIAAARQAAKELRSEFEGQLARMAKKVRGSMQLAYILACGWRILACGWCTS